MEDQPEEGTAAVSGLRPGQKLRLLKQSLSQGRQRSQSEHHMLCVRASQPSLYRHKITRVIPQAATSKEEETGSAFHGAAYQLRTDPTRCLAKWGSTHRQAAGLDLF